MEREGVHSEPSQKFPQLPVNSNCAKKWRESPDHSKNCECLEVEARETYLLFANSLKSYQESLKECQCEKSKKVRISSDYYTWCEIREVGIPAASKKRVIKNRNDPKFWGLNVKERVLCSDCLEKKQNKINPFKASQV